MIVYPIYIGKNSVAAEYFKRQLDGAIAVVADHAEAVRSISADALNKPLLFFYEKSNQKIDGQRIDYLKTQYPLSPFSLLEIPKRYLTTNHYRNYVYNQLKEF